MKESRIVNIISILVLISVFSLNTEAQDYYSSKEYVEYNNVRYRVTHYPGSVYVGNTANHMREVPRHKVGSRSNRILYLCFWNGAYGDIRCGPI